jgi:hypothetical protein
MKTMLSYTGNGIVVNTNCNITKVVFVGDGTGDAILSQGNALTLVAPLGIANFNGGVVATNTSKVAGNGTACSGCWAAFYADAGSYILHWSIIACGCTYGFYMTSKASIDCQNSILAGSTTGGYVDHGAFARVTGTLCPGDTTTYNITVNTFSGSAYIDS